MRLFGRRSTTDDAAAVPEDLQPYYTTSSGWRRWLGPVFRIAMALVVLALLVWGGVALAHKISGNHSSNDKNTTAQTSDHRIQGSDNGSASNSNSGSTEKPSPSPSPTPAPTPKPAPSPAATPSPVPSSTGNTGTSSTSTTRNTTNGTGQTAAPSTTYGSTQNSQLANTGPGQMAALFAASTIAGVLFYYGVLARRLNKQQ